MNDEMKKLLSRFLFINVLICCLGLLTSGSITASQKSAKTTFDKAYAVMSVKTTGKRVEINMGEERFDFDINLTDKIKGYEDYIMLTPAASVYYFGKCIKNLATQGENHLLTKEKAVTDTP